MKNHPNKLECNDRSLFKITLKQLKKKNYIDR